MAQDDKAIAYIGEFNSGASAISMPTLNEAGILQVSPSNTGYGLTKSGTGAEPGEPDKYYPTGERHYGRVVPIDTIQAAAQAHVHEGRGRHERVRARRHGGVRQGPREERQGRAGEARASSSPERIPGTARRRTTGRWRSKIKSSGADAVFTAGIVQNNSPQLYKDLNAAMPDAKLFGPDGVAVAEHVGELPDKVQAQSYLTVPTLAPEELPPSGQQFYKDFEAEYGKAQDEIAPYAVYGYESMAVVCDAIAQGGDDKKAVIDAFFATKGRESPLGTYDIDPDGDTTLSDYGGYTAEGGKLVFNKVIKAAVELDRRH